MKAQLWCLLISTLVAASALEQNNRCQGFDYVYHFGDGLTDIGNSVLVPPINEMAAAFPPYGRSVPPYTPNGRWADGLNDFDYAAIDFGIPDIQPYLKKNFTHGVIFSVARSPVLSRGFFAEKGIKLASCAVSLDEQMEWFKNYLKVICKDSKSCISTRLNESFMLLGDIEGNDIGYALSQGKSINEALSYVPIIIKKQIQVARELLRLGANKLVIPGSSLIGCYPYILTARATREPLAYDDLGCLKDVNWLIRYKNKLLNESVNTLRKQYPNRYISYAPYDEGFLRYFQKVAKTVNRRHMLKACCGTGGMYNYDEANFCSTAAASVCPDPKKYVFWDGLHMTDEAQFQIEQDLIQDFLTAFNCTRVPHPRLSASAQEAIKIASIENVGSASI